MTKQELLDAIEKASSVFVWCDFYMNEQKPISPFDGKYFEIEKHIAVDNISGMNNSTQYTAHFWEETGMLFIGETH
jgi:hypothetical protein